MNWSGLRDWSPAPLVKASALLHGLGGVALLAQPRAWPAILGGLALNHAVLACGMHPRSSLIGRNITGLAEPGVPRLALTFDDGPHPEHTPRVLDILDAFGARGTFFLIGQRAGRFARLARSIRERGHGVGNHTHRHAASFACWGPWRLRRDISDAQKAIEDACGRTPRVFRAPMGLRSPLLDPVLAAEGLSLVSWTRRGFDTVSPSPERIVGRLTRGLAAGDILLLHDAGSRTGPDGRPVVLDVLPELLRRIAAAGLRATAVPDGPRAGSPSDEPG